MNYNPFLKHKIFKFHCNLDRFILIRTDSKAALYVGSIGVIVNQFPHVLVMVEFSYQ